MQRVEDICDLKYCTDGVQTALQEEDYEKVCEVLLVQGTEHKKMLALTLLRLTLLNRPCLLDFQHIL